ncbi:MAG: hypothetical protein R2684_10250 [Pyrinomonadaceae bacterium]
MNSKWKVEGFLETVDGELTIAGRKATEIVSELGSPVFVYSGARIRSNIARLRKIEDRIGCRLKICYASKANSEAEILKIVREAGIDCEVNSGGELQMALDAGFAPSQINFNGNSKTEEELEAAIRVGIYAIQADSVYEIELTEKVAKRIGMRANVSPRMVPDIQTDTLHGLQTALVTSKFGMMPYEAVGAFHRWKNDDPHINLCGLHIHVGSQNPKAGPYRDALLSLFHYLKQIHDETGRSVGHLNIGGGFPVKYLHDDLHARYMDREQAALLSTELEPSDIVGAAWTAVSNAAKAAGAEHLLSDIDLLIEPGRSVIGNAAVCLTTVRNRKSRPVAENEPEDIWLLTDAGFNILLSMETYKWYYQLISATRADEPHERPYKVAGPLCDGGDVYFDIEGERRLPDFRVLPDNIVPGDLLALLNTGAYTVSQMFPYNGRPLPKVLVID